MPFGHDKHALARPRPNDGRAGEIAERGQQGVVAAEIEAGQREDAAAAAERDGRMDVAGDGIVTSDE